MTKKELIEILEQYPDEAEIYLQDIEEVYRGIKRIYLPLKEIFYYEINKSQHPAIILADGN